MQLLDQFLKIRRALRSALVTTVHTDDQLARLRMLHEELVDLQLGPSDTALQYAAADRLESRGHLKRAARIRRDVKVEQVWVLHRIEECEAEARRIIGQAASSTFRLYDAMRELVPIHH